MARASRLGRPRGNERRITERVLKLWESSENDTRILPELKSSDYWKHCFLVAHDRDLRCSSILEAGGLAARGLGLASTTGCPLSLLNPILAESIHLLGTACRNERKPEKIYEKTIEPGPPFGAYRLLLLPLMTVKAKGPRPSSDSRVSLLLGVLTYR